MNPFVKWLLSPLSEWHAASLQHKFGVGSAGAAAFWYFHKYHNEWPLWQRGLAAVGAAYATSMIFNSVQSFSALALPKMALPSLPAVPGITAPIYPSAQTPLDMAPAPQMMMMPEPAFDMQSVQAKPDMSEDSGVDEGIFGS